MADGLPAQEAVEIFNKLVRTAPVEAREIARAEWRLRALGRARPGDITVEVALLYALQMSGKADEAVRLAERLWHRRNFMPAEQLDTFLFELAHLGMYEKADEILGEIRDGDGARLITNIDAVAVTVSWCLGDIERASAAIKEAPPSVWGNWLVFVDQIKGLGFGPHLAARYKIIRQKTFQRQCLSQLVLTPGGEFPLELTHYVYVAGSYEERVALEEEIQITLDSYFEPLGLGGTHWGLMIELVAPITAAPAWHKDLFVKAA
jgi:hypothetical protein